MCATFDVFIPKRATKTTGNVLDLRLSPASFRFHSKVPIRMRLDVKVNRGIYRTTELGSLCFNLLEKQARLMLKIESIISSVSSDFCSAHRACLYFLDSFNGHVYVAVVAEA